MWVCLFELLSWNNFRINCGGSRVEIHPWEVRSWPYRSWFWWSRSPVKVGGCWLLFASSNWYGYGLGPLGITPHDTTFCLENNIQVGYIAPPKLQNHPESPPKPTKSWNRKSKPKELPAETQTENTKAFAKAKLEPAEIFSLLLWLLVFFTLAFKIHQHSKSFLFHSCFNSFNSQKKSAFKFLAK